MPYSAFVDRFRCAEDKRAHIIQRAQRRTILDPDRAREMSGPASALREDRRCHGGPQVSPNANERIDTIRTAMDAASAVTTVATRLKKRCRRTAVVATGSGQDGLVRTSTRMALTISLADSLLLQIDTVIN
jgi:hypothetical protein